VRRRGSLTAALAAVLLVLLPASASAEFGMAPGSLRIEMLDRDGHPEVRAGVHPDRFKFEMAFKRTPEDLPDGGTLSDLRIALPRGVVGDPLAVPRCERETLTLVHWDVCPPETQIGVAELDAIGFPVSIPIYNAEPRPGNVAEFGFKWLIVAHHLVAGIEADGRLSIKVSHLLEDQPLKSMKIELWGVPADHLEVDAPRRSFLTAPTRCGVAEDLAVEYRSWQEPQVWHRAAAALPPFEGCEDLTFDPRVEFGLERSSADTPTGAEIGVTLPPEAGPDERAHDRIESLSLRMPEGMTVALGVANSMKICPEAAIKFGTREPDDCPPASRLGTVELHTPMLSAPVAGRVYMGGQLPGGDLRLYAVTSGGGVVLKLPVLLSPDPVTGRLTTVLEGLPALPLERIALRFDGGARAPLVTPLHCGPATATGTLTSYGGKRVTVVTSAPVTSATGGGPCLSGPGFDPSFTAGSLNARAGAISSFAATIRRRDGDQPLSRFSLTLPKGSVARLAVAGRCPEAAIALNTCPEASRIGRAVVEAGTGPSPVAMRGELFLTGPYRTTRPYRRSPVGLAIVIDGLAGPFDLGTIVVRTGMRLDSRTGQVSIDSDPLPQVVRGIPVRLQTLGIDIDRRGFSSNPTSCEPAAVTARLESTDGRVVERASRFAVGGCRKLRFRPRLAMTLTGRSELRRGGNPGLRMRIRSATEGANIRSAIVAMPALLTGSPIGPEAICSLRQALSGRCPAAARIGRTSARTPLMKRPLRGSVYLVQPRGKGLPDVWAMLGGEGVKLGARMRTVVEDGRIRGEIVDLPDVPLETFTIDFAGGKRGMFEAKRSACVSGRARPMGASARLKAYSGAARKLALRVGAPGCRR
jgi:hypothetical protein